MTATGSSHGLFLPWLLGHLDTKYRTLLLILPKVPNEVDICSQDTVTVTGFHDKESVLRQSFKVSLTE